MDFYHIALGYAAWSAFWGLMVGEEIDRIYWETSGTFLSDLWRTTVAILSAGLMIPAALVAVLGMDAFEWVTSKVRK